MKRVVGGILGAVAGLGFSTMGLIEVRDGFDLGGGNENTSTVIGIGAVLGALIGAGVLWRWPLAIVGLIVGLAAGIWLRDNLGRPLPGVQPPWVFLLLFGLPALGAAGGYLMHLPRATWARHASAGASFLGLASAAVIYLVASTLWTTLTRDPACEPRPQPGGGLLVPLCSEPATPLWIAAVAVAVRIVVVIVVYRWLTTDPLQRSEGTPERA
jgi:hypothetical protein